MCYYEFLKKNTPKPEHTIDNPPMVPVVLVFLVALILVALVSFVLTYAIRRANGAEPVGQRVTRRAQHVQEIDMSDHVLNQKPLPGMVDQLICFMFRYFNIILEIFT